jgi:hypothetical protein
MAYRVYFDEKGKPYIETDSPEEAIRVAQSRLPPAQSAPVARPEQTLRFPREVDPAILKKAFGEMNANAKLFLLKLSAHPKGVRGDELDGATGFAIEKFGGIVGGASKIMKKYGMSLDNLLDSRQIVKGSQRYRFIKPTAILVNNVELLRSVTAA